MTHIHAPRDPAAALREHESRNSEAQTMTTVPARGAAQLQGNHTLMQPMARSATPAILYLVDTGVLQTEQGASQPATLAKTLGAR